MRQATKDLLRPFAFRHFRRFLRQYWLRLLVVLALPFVAWAVHATNYYLTHARMPAPISAGTGPVAGLIGVEPVTENYLNQKISDFDEVGGVVNSDEWYCVTVGLGGLPGVALWDEKKGRYIAGFRGTVWRQWAMYRDTDDRLIWVLSSYRQSEIFVLSPEENRVIDHYIIRGMFEAAAINPSGTLVAGVARPRLLGEQLPYNLTCLTLLDLTTGDVTRQNLPLSHVRQFFKLSHDQPIFFEDDDIIIGVQEKSALVRYDLSREEKPELIYQLGEDEYLQFVAQLDNGVFLSVEKDSLGRNSLFHDDIAIRLDIKKPEEAVRKPLPRTFFQPFGIGPVTINSWYGNHAIGRSETGDYDRPSDFWLIDLNRSEAFKLPESSSSFSFVDESTISGNSSDQTKPVILTIGDIKNKKSYSGYLTQEDLEGNAGAGGSSFFSL